MSAAPRTPPRLSEGLLSKNGVMPLTPDSVLSPPRSGGRRATAGGESIDFLDVITLWEGKDRTPTSPVTERNSGGIGLVGVRTYLGAREFDDEGKRRVACSTTVGCCPIAGHGPMRFGCSFAGDTMCSNCGCVMCIGASSIGREVVLLDETSSSNLFGTIISIQDVGSGEGSSCTVRVPNGSENVVVEAAKLRVRLLECSAGPTECCNFHLCSSCYLGREDDNISHDSVPFSMSLDFSELLYDVELVDSATCTPITFEQIFSKQVNSSSFGPASSWAGPADRGINFMVLALFAVLQLTPSVLTTKVVAQKILKTLTRKFNCPAAVLFEGVAIKLSNGRVVPATGQPEHFISQAPEDRFIEGIGTALAYFKSESMEPADVFVFEPSFCVNQWTEERGGSGDQYGALSPAVTQAVVSCKKTLFLEAPSRREKYQLGRLYQLLDVYNTAVKGEEAPFETLPPHQQKAFIENIFSASRPQEHLAILSMDMFHEELAHSKEGAARDDEATAKALDSLIERDEAKLEALEAEQDKSISREAHEKLALEIKRVQDELDDARTNLNQTEARIARELEEARREERAASESKHHQLEKRLVHQNERITANIKALHDTDIQMLREHHGRESAAWRVKHMELERRLAEESGRLAENVKELHEAELDALRENHGRETSERDTFWQSKHKELENRLLRENERLTVNLKKRHAAEIQRHGSMTESLVKAYTKRIFSLVVTAVLVVVFAFIAGGAYQSRTGFYDEHISPGLVHAKTIVTEYYKPVTAEPKRRRRFCPLRRRRSNDQ